VVIAEKVNNAMGKEDKQFLFKGMFPAPGLTGGRLAGNHHVPQQTRLRGRDRPRLPGKRKNIRRAVNVPVGPVQLMDFRIIG